MKVLWITNILFPEPLSEIDVKSEIKASGGWMLGAAFSLIQKDDVRLYVATVSPLVNELTRIQGNKITYYIIPMGKGNMRENNDYNEYWVSIESEIKPDVIHIHGTEYSHGLSYLKSCSNENVVISIQGLTSACYHYYNYGISNCEIFLNLTLRDLIKGSLIRDQRNFKSRSQYEIEMLQLTKHIIGRTTWDRARTWAINPSAKYYFCNETLRPEFYDGSEWTYDKCHKHTIFYSQATYPIKGLHQLLKAMPYILRYYPDLEVRIAGNNILQRDNVLQKIRATGYSRYLLRIINKNHLKDHIVFTGSLNAEEMKQEYLKANLFLSSSSIENSPNSLGEAQILGVPCLASYVGGTMDMMEGNTDSLYRFEEYEMLAYKVCEIFAKGPNQADMRAVASKRHNPTINSNQLYQIYKSIIGE